MASLTATREAIDEAVSEQINALLKKDLPLSALITSSNTNDSKYLPGNQGGNLVQKWVSIKSTTSTMEQTTNDVTVVFLAVKTYNTEQTAQIKKALSESLNNDEKQCPIKISSNGTILFKNNEKIINESIPSSGKEKNWDDIDDNYYSINILSWDSEKVISSSLRYILWLNEDKKSYSLLYNPIHRTSFRNYYIQSLRGGGIDIDGLPVPDSQIYNAITGYCNAFIVKGKAVTSGPTTTAQKPEIYLDPFCGIIMDRISYILNTTLNNSITSDWYKKHYWQDNKVKDALIDFYSNRFKLDGNFKSFQCSGLRDKYSLYKFGTINSLYSETGNDSFLSQYNKLNMAYINGTTLNSSEEAYEHLLTGKTSDCTQPDVINCNLLLITSVGSISGNTISGCEDLEKNFSGTPDTKPGTPDTKPGTPDTKPGTPYTKPGTPYTKPGTPYTKPIYGDASKALSEKLKWLKQKSMYIYILIAILIVLIIGLSIYFFTRKSPTVITKPLEAISAFGRYIYR